MVRRSLSVLKVCNKRKRVRFDQTKRESAKCDAHAEARSQSLQRINPSAAPSRPRPSPAHNPFPMMRATEQRLRHEPDILSTTRSGGTSGRLSQSMQTPPPGGRASKKAYTMLSVHRAQALLQTLVNTRSPYHSLRPRRAPSKRAASGARHARHRCALLALMAHVAASDIPDR